jgi:uncharacterized repeat protein (TIGR01451 family)
VVVTMMIAVAVPGSFTTGGGVANAAPITGGDITVVCAGTTSGTTFTLTANCGEVTSSLTVPAGITTVDGGGFTISATDLNGADPTVHTPIPQFNGAIVTNTPGEPMNIRNVRITGPATGFSLCGPQDPGANAVLYGIFFNGAAGGSVTNVTVDHIFQFQNGAFGSCQTGRAIRAENSGTVTITNTVVKDYQKSGFEPRGSTTMNISGSTAGPAHPLEGLISQNGVSYVGAAGRVENNTIFGSGNAQAGVGGNGAGTAVLLSGAHDVTVTNNTLTSPAAPRPGTDIGISVSAGSSTGIVISFNKVNRLGPDVPDTSGLGIDVFTPDGSKATLMCNTFSQWITNVVGAEQIACTPLPNGAECQAYSAPAPAVDSGKNYGPEDIIDATPFTWTVDSGTLPPGLSLSSGGAITGTPTAAGTFNFTMKLVDSTGLTATQAQTIIISPGCAPPANPSIAIEKSPSSQTVALGGTATFHITVTNNGNVTLTNVNVSDPLSANCNRDLGTLAVGASQTYTCTRSNVRKKFVNTAEAVGTAPNGTIIRASATAPVKVSGPFVPPARPAIRILKGPNAQSTRFGGVARFRITVKNIGNVRLRKVSVTDPLTPGCNRRLGTLTVGASKTYSCMQPHVMKSFLNRAHVVGTARSGRRVTDTDSAAVTTKKPAFTG